MRVTIGWRSRAKGRRLRVGRKGAIFVDRDGVINEDRDDYVKNLGELKIHRWAPRSVRRLSDAGLRVFVVSNQQGVAKGVISEQDLRQIQDEIVREVETVGGRISAFYYCKHLESEHCPCRKPKPGLLLQAAREHSIDLGESVMIGDSERDVLAGKAAGCKTVAVLTGALTSQAAHRCAPDYVARDLAEAVDFVLGAGG